MSTAPGVWICTELDGAPRIVFADEDSARQWVRVNPGLRRCSWWGIWR